VTNPSNPRRVPADMSPMPRGCLDRLSLIAVTSGRCNTARLPEVSRHLRGCARCRAQVVRAAEGRLGDTVEDEPRGARRRWSWALPLALSVVAVAGYGRTTVDQAPAQRRIEAASLPVELPTAAPAPARATAEPFDTSVASTPTRPPVLPCAPASGPARPARVASRVLAVTRGVPTASVAPPEATGAAVEIVNGRFIRVSL
jgi:hypothetical protein